MQLICAIELKLGTACARRPATAPHARTTTRFTTVNTLLLGISLLDASATRPKKSGGGGRHENTAKLTMSTQ